MDDFLFPCFKISLNVIILFHSKKKKNYTSNSLGFESIPERPLRKSHGTPSPFFPDGKVVSRRRWPSRQSFSTLCPAGSLTELGGVKDDP